MYSPAISLLNDDAIKKAIRNSDAALKKANETKAGWIRTDINRKIKECAAYPFHIRLEVWEQSIDVWEIVKREIKQNSPWEKYTMKERKSVWWYGEFDSKIIVNIVIYDPQIQTDD